jgi:hypothetical protein
LPAFRKRSPSIAQRVLDEVPPRRAKTTNAPAGFLLHTLDDLLSVQISVAHYGRCIHRRVCPARRSTNTAGAQAQARSSDIAAGCAPPAASRDHAHFKDLQDVLSAFR